LKWFFDIKEDCNGKEAIQPEEIVAKLGRWMIWSRRADNLADDVLPLDRGASGKNNVRREGCQFRRVFAKALDIARRPAGVDPHIAHSRTCRSADATRPGGGLTAKRLHRRSPKGHRKSLREIASELATMGYTNKRGAPYSASCVKSMVEGPSP
jgi:hypothetical protein